ncbi:MAG: lactate dehydrogenase [Firmicutes bacterium]|nr:lactate dehydrogenase [Bacillota bacterium]
MTDNNLRTAADIKRSISELCPGRDALALAGPLKKSGYKVNILALGDVGATLLLGLKTQGGGIIDTIGIFDVNENVMARYEIEMNQIGWPFGTKNLPEVVCLKESELFDCDMFVFCASKAIPPIGTSGDVRMMQLEANSKIAAHYGRLAGDAGFRGIFAVVSDPVDPLCKAVLLSSGLEPGQVRGYGLGVMNKRAEYFAKKDERFASYLAEGRAFGPHGGDLVIANSIENYDDELSRELTRLTVEANLQVRALGFKPYFAPAFSSGAISLLLTLTGQWNCSSVYLGKGDGGAFLGIKNRIADNGEVEIEDLPLPQKLYDRIELAYDNLCRLNQEI